MACSASNASMAIGGRADEEGRPHPGPLHHHCVHCPLTAGGRGQCTEKIRVRGVKSSQDSLHASGKLEGVSTPDFVQVGPVLEQQPEIRVDVPGRCLECDDAVRHIENPIAEGSICLVLPLDARC